MSINDLETKKVLEENLVLDLENTSGSRRVGDIKAHLKGIRHEIEELKKCLIESPEFITEEEYQSIPKIPLRKDEILRIKSESYGDAKNEARFGNYPLSNVNPVKLFNTFLSGDIIEFYTTNRSETSPVSCQSKTFLDDINFFINLQQVDSNDKIDLLYQDVNPSYVRFGDIHYLISGDHLTELIKFIKEFYSKYYENLQNLGGNADLVDLSSIHISFERLSLIDSMFVFLLSFFENTSTKNKRDVLLQGDILGLDTLEQDSVLGEDCLSEDSLDVFLKNRKQIIIKKVWA